MAVFAGANLSLSFNSTGSCVLPFAEEREVGGRFRNIVNLTVANGEVVTITHGKDNVGARAIRFIDSSGADVVYGSSKIASAVRTSATVTTVTAGSSGAGTYLMEISY